MAGVLAALVCVAGLGIVLQERPAAAEAGLTQEQLVARGDYLTHHVAQCVMCHSPKDDAGNVITSREFTGAPIPFRSPFPKGRPWATNAPALAPIARGQEGAMYALLTTSIWPPLGESPLYPMPHFKMTDEDARSVIAYLKTK
jgi:mono/diheme cytochrome c family protein